MKKLSLVLLLASSFIHCYDACYSCNRFEVGPHFSYVNIKFEEDPSSDGFISGASALFMHYQQDGLYIDTYFKGSWTRNLKDYLAEARAGYTFDLCEGSFVAVYSGLGYNRLRFRRDTDDIEQTFRYNKVYIPIGAFGLWQINNCFSLGARVKVKPDLHPILSLEPPLTAATDDTFLKLDYRYGIDIQIPATYYFNGECVSGLISLIPYLDWNIYGRELFSNQVRSLRRILTGAQLVIGVEY